MNEVTCSILSTVGRTGFCSSQRISQNFYSTTFAHFILPFLSYFEHKFIFFILFLHFLEISYSWFPKYSRLFLFPFCHFWSDCFFVSDFSKPLIYYIKFYNRTSSLYNLDMTDQTNSMRFCNNSCMVNTLDPKKE